MTWIQTASGKAFYPLNPNPNDIDIDDIAHALAMKCRYNGHTSHFYSVAEHSVHVSFYVPAQYALWALLHDASEAYLPDISRPIKPHMAGFRAIEDRVMNAVTVRFGLQMPEPVAVQMADTAILHDEKAALMPHDPLPWNLPGKGLGVRIECWSPTEAKVKFLQRFRALGGVA